MMINKEQPTRAPGAPRIYIGYQVVRTEECFGYDRPHANVGSFFVIAACDDGSEWAHFHRAERAIAPDMDVPDMIPEVFWKLIDRMRERGISPRRSKHWGPLPTGRRVYRERI